MYKIMFVCHGNICRSPMAQVYMQNLIEAQGLQNQFLVNSSATTTEEIWNGRGNPIYPPAMDELRKHGLDGPLADSLRASLLTRADLEKYDYFIGMDRENLRDMRRILGRAAENKISLLLDYTDHPRDVADPWYTGNFRDTWEDIEAGCQGLLEQLLKNQ
ncbi:MAG: low molecular weight phosphotyrosine protein phosphatase [Eubacterium sp.]|nr:low molecular weight phosphotyrosine protein phosphatase [Eubacterium sp.]MCH4045894.1 low molecular weight phosphotyrosine protein phosphatase [Eubacterium sp.]MCH4078988.1 low molecular weight phosphotyrosine protein phosphatase [Eubacterium sp.]MCI1307642.1 low molecular weight phosphotyrosine protein phosphatase [Eubacterium sp.]MCI1428389.1 low molecular weight phosphotyrosine protein phosphatase [Eubacterium sp.]